MYQFQKVAPYLRGECCQVAVCKRAEQQIILEHPALPALIDEALACNFQCLACPVHGRRCREVDLRVDHALVISRDRCDKGASLHQRVRWL